MAKRQRNDSGAKTSKPICGIVMPISDRDGCSARHWQDVLEILTAAAELAGFQGKLVSSAAHIGVIHQTIVDNLFDNPIVICDVSTENPNVMFELGLRLAFDKPTIVVIDSETKIQFDTSPIEHLRYPRDLRFGSIIEFKETLATKLKATISARENPNFTTFLRAFKRLTAAELLSEDATPLELMANELKLMREQMALMKSVVNAKDPTVDLKRTNTFDHLSMSIRSFLLHQMRAYRVTDRNALSRLARDYFASHPEWKDSFPPNIDEAKYLEYMIESQLKVVFPIA